MNTFSFVRSSVNDSTRVSQAEPRHTDAVMELLIKTAEWLRSKGSRQWNGLLEGRDHHGMAEAISAGHVFVFEQESRLAGVVMLLQQPGEWDRQLWGEEGHEEAVYVHRLAVNRDCAGTRLGRDMMAWVETGIRFPGKSKIRLDCVGDNPRLNEFYRSLGYEYQGLSASGFSKYEKLLSSPKT
ncbi:GNAT family N-acetyltransferase [Paenibacillus doosanensis]|uniref:Acetyltransferase n=1 Tax=Paenibacillus konkukensis TaxID=2020716 RepID=A0ABY4RH41_9BACL|nr:MULTISPECIES: GNAT family N-acetyltransferase [Paenibacillus]MCS7461172.1 GNAT family N-acetyltransferase [Paenibacillus doosanensis]UQZ81672.1 putative acetyltransferase [Paenibacillus konkukensis]